jgi:hypothetical protein
MLSAIRVPTFLHRGRGPVSPVFTMGASPLQKTTTPPERKIARRRCLLAAGPYPQQEQVCQDAPYEGVSVQSACRDCSLRRTSRQLLSATVSLQPGRHPIASAGPRQMTGEKSRPLRKQEMQKRLISSDISSGCLFPMHEQLRRSAMVRSETVVSAKAMTGGLRQASRAKPAGEKTSRMWPRRNRAFVPLMEQDF